MRPWLRPITRSLATRVVATLLLLAVASCPRPAVVMDDRDPTGPADDGTLSVSLRTVLATASGERSVMDGETLHSGDRVHFVLRVTQPAYVYLVLFAPDGSASVLYPAAGAPAQPVAARCPLRIPTRGTLYLENPAGEEEVRVVASQQPLGTADRVLCEQLRLPCDADAQKGAAPPPACPPEATRAIFTGVKVGTATNHGVASLRARIRHDP